MRTLSILTILLLAASHHPPAAAQARLHTLKGTQYSEHLGSAVALVDDLSGDGMADILTGAPYYNGIPGADAGRVRVYSGSSGAHLYDVHWPRNHSWLGYSLANIGDLDGDGMSDWIAGAPLDKFNGIQAGAGAVYSGADGSLIRVHYGPAPDDLLGWSVAGVGDIDGDGIPDYAAGAPRHDGSGNDAGLVRVWSGADGSLIHDIHGAAPSGNFGVSISACGDVDGDGIPDLLVGAQREYSSGHFDGYVRIISGNDGSTLLHVPGPASVPSGFGSTVAAIGVAKGGPATFVVGSPWDGVAEHLAGRVSMYSSSTGELIWSTTGEPGIWLGGAVSTLGDFNGDGYVDVLAGARRWGSNHGDTWVLSGANGAILARFPGILASELSGSAVAGGRDVDGDGALDFIIGVPGDSTVQTRQGAARVFSSACLGPQALCIPKTSSLGCIPAIGWLGTPSRWATDDFHVTADQILSNTLGIFIWSRADQVVPWNGGYLCLRNPIFRTGVQFSGVSGSHPDCSGQFAFHFSHSVMANGGLDVGTTVFGQYWYRDPEHLDGTGIGLSEGIEFTLCP